MVITVLGEPAPQGSKRHVGNGVMIESSKKVRPWREAVTWEARALLNSGTAAITGPVALRVTFTVRKPKSAPKTRVTFPDRTPDLSKLVRSTEDALTIAGVWEDDARVVECHAAKRYPNEGRDSLPSPGAVICIESLVSAVKTE